MLAFIGRIVVLIWGVIRPALRVALNAVVDLLVDFVLWIWDNLRHFLGQVVAYVETLMPQAWVDFLNSEPWEPILDFVEPFQWFIPFYEMLAIVVLGYTICATIRLGRVILGLVPGVNV